MQRIRRALIELAPRMYAESVLLRDLRMLEIGMGIDPREMPIPSTDVGGWVAVHPGSHWGGYDQNAWFHASATVPDGWMPQLDDDERRVVLRLLVGKGTEFGWPEGLLYVNGRLQQGINRHHPDVLLRPEDVLGASLTFDVRAWSGMLPIDHTIETAEMALLDRPTERLVHLLRAGADLVDALDANDPLLYPLTGALDAAYDAVELSPTGFYPSVRRALAQLEAVLREVSQRYQGTTRPIVTAVGHGHLDVAWLWQTRHTREKAARTFSVATALMDAYPEYVFLHTTPQVFAWLKSDYPSLYDRVRVRVEDGRFEAAGAMWVESDCNLVSGESLVRQILYGQRFLREEFGREYDALWLPDAFGYSAALPQIMLRAGIPLFMTTKMSWSETNRIPTDTFHWRGVDGSTVLAHFITTPDGGSGFLGKTDTYNGALTARAVRGVWERYREKAVNDEVLLAYGHGDGGAGPTRQHLEQARALQQLPGMPELRLGRADAFFERLRARVDDNPQLPVWDGELYLEYHRGTYTTQSWLKRMHRQLEGALVTAEWLDAWQWSRCSGQTQDRRESLDDAWRTLLMHEFHDILPGSSIATVYYDARQSLTELAGKLKTLTDEMVAALFADVPRDGQDGVAILNPSPFPRRDVVALPGFGDERVPMVDGRCLPAQRTAGEASPTMLVELPELPGRGACLIEWRDASSAEHATPSHDSEISGESVAVGEDEEGIWLKNAYVSLRLNTAGEIVSLRDLRVEGGREVIPADAAANALTVYEDLPREFDAWDIDEYYTRKPYSVETTDVNIVEHGPLRAVVRVERRFRSSKITQRVILHRTSPRIDFETHIDWHEKHVLLKAAFPLDIRTSRATGEIQYGAIERAVHRNASWERARFEVPAHRWMDLSEGDYGVSLLNDGRYGHDVADGKIGLTLLRSPTWPDPQADQGENTVTYSLYPHPGDWRLGGTVSEGYALNRPLLTQTIRPAETNDQQRPSGSSDGTIPAMMFGTDMPNVVVEAIKRAADGEGIVVRLYESTGRRVHAVIRSTLPLGSVVECDLLERPLTPGSSPAYALWQRSSSASHDAPEVAGESWSCDFRPFEIRTFRVMHGQ